MRIRCYYLFKRKFKRPLSDGLWIVRLDEWGFPPRLAHVKKAVVLLNTGLTLLRAMRILEVIISLVVIYEVMVLFYHLSLVYIRAQDSGLPVAVLGEIIRH